VWDVKHRPLTFNDVLGQSGTVQILKARLKNGTALDTNYIFSGSSGAGKTTLARIFARALLCQDLSREDPEPCNKCDNCTSILSDTSRAFVEQDAASQGNIEQIKRIVDDLPFAVLGASKRIYLFDECFTEDTLLVTRTGTLTIKEIVEGKLDCEVLSYDIETKTEVWKRVTDWFNIQDLRDLIRLTFGSGVVLTVTPDQELYVKGRGWVPAKDLTSKDAVVESLGDVESLEEIFGAFLLKKEFLPKGKVYDVTVEGTHSFFASSKVSIGEGFVLAHNCHRLSKDAQDVLLKPLEERKLLGMFCTTEPEKVRGAIRSRCEEYHIRKVTRDDILERMKKILSSEGVEFEDDAVLTVIDYSGGHVRDVVNRLEMVSQLGPVSLDSVREYLNLSVVSTYYEILLRLPTDTKGALQLIDQVCDRLTPEEVASGLAEAAMNSFRLANGMSADFTFADKALSQKVNSLYGQQLISVSKYFLGSRYLTQVGLVCDVVSLAQSLGGGRAIQSTPEPLKPSFTPLALPKPQVTQEPPVQPQEPSEPPTSLEPPQEPPPTSSPLTLTPPPSRTIPVVQTLELNPEIREDGVGNLNSSDKEALTEFDTVVVPKGKPKGKRTHSIDFDSRLRDNRDILTASLWRIEFQKVWLNRGYTNGNSRMGGP
jgi:DNA polymerase III gamma/tau subunit